MQKTLIGLIVGTGTGPELAEVFRRMMKEASSLFDLNIEIEEDNCRAKTYWELKRYNWRDIEERENNDFVKLLTFLQRIYNRGCRIIFRTAINAEVLYQIRKKGLAVKVFSMQLKDGRKILMIRDEMQGFYTNDEHQLSNEIIKFTGTFCSTHLHKIYDYSKKVAKNYLADGFSIWAMYKYHLFANLIEQWFREISDRIKVYQPDSGIDLLIKYVNNASKYGNDLLLLTGNEIGDILCEFMMYLLDIGNKDVLFSKDVFLCPELFGLTMYQTIHGSADDIAGKNIVNPFATLRAAGDLIECGLGINGFYSVLQSVLQKAMREGVITPDLSGTKSTTEVVDYVLEELRLRYQNKLEIKEDIR